MVAHNLYILIAIIGIYFVGVIHIVDKEFISVRKSKKDYLKFWAYVCFFPFVMISHAAKTWTDLPDE